MSDSEESAVEWCTACGRYHVPWNPCPEDDGTTGVRTL